MHVLTAPQLAFVKIVLDTNILVRANPTVSPQSLGRDILLTIVGVTGHTLILSSAILAELGRHAHLSLSRSGPVANAEGKD